MVGWHLRTMRANGGAVRWFYVVGSVRLLYYVLFIVDYLNGSRPGRRSTSLCELPLYGRYIGGRVCYTLALVKSIRISSLGRGAGG